MWLPKAASSGAVSRSREPTMSFRSFRASPVSAPALIEMPNADYIDFPLDHAVLLCAIQDTRANEEHHCQVLSEMHEAAVQRLVDYARNINRVYANARFLKLREPVKEDGASNSRPCRIEASAQAAVRRMVDTLVRAFDKTGIDMTVFKPNHFATLCV